jgi:iron(II)-dependent oxidoreductase
MEMNATAISGAGVLGSHPTDRMDRADIVARLEDARARTRWLLDRVDDERLHTQHNPLMSPLVWDAGHIGVYEELWLVMNVAGSAAINEPRMRFYDAFDNPRAIRGELPLMRRDAVEDYRDEVRRRVYGILDEIDLDGDDPLVTDGFVYDMVIAHESQHNETLLQALQLMPGGYRADVHPVPPGRRVTLDTVAVAAGTYPIGSDTHEPYDNEHPRHTVALRAFAIDRFPVTCGQYLAFIEARGYERRELWNPEGWEWRETEGATAPAYWQHDGSHWYRDSFGRRVPVEPDHPVMHVSWFEADAYCRWAGRRLPTEFEWEVAASWDPDTGTARRYPWGSAPWRPELANLDQRAFGAAPVGAYPAGASALGCEQMLGDVYEWTSSDFTGYPGFRSFPYPQYSEVFFGSAYKVLRGASWATRPWVARATFRNWDYPIRRQIFSGFRTVIDDSVTEATLR